MARHLLLFLPPFSLSRDNNNSKHFILFHQLLRKELEKKGGGGENGTRRILSMSFVHIHKFPVNASFSLVIREQAT